MEFSNLMIWALIFLYLFCGFGCAALLHFMNDLVNDGYNEPEDKYFYIAAFLFSPLMIFCIYGVSIYRYIDNNKHKIYIWIERKLRN